MSGEFSPGDMGVKGPMGSASLPLSIDPTAPASPEPWPEGQRAGRGLGRAGTGLLD